MTHTELRFTFDGEEQRLDKFLVTCLPDFSRSRLQGLISAGMILVNQQPAVKAGQTLNHADLVTVFLPETVSAGLVAEKIDLDVIFESPDLMVINKPAGMVVHPGAGHDRGTLVHAALYHSPEMEGIGGELRPGVVHRLDKDTSGLILLAKNDSAHAWLQEQFIQRQVVKTYLALVDGKPPTPTGRVEAPIGRDPSHRQQMAVVPLSRGREAVTEYFTREVFTRHTLLEAHPLSGRTHQIRVHLAFLGCPVAGDTLYGHRKPSFSIGRHFLHAAHLQIILPGETSPRQFDAPLPEELTRILEDLRRE